MCPLVMRRSGFDSPRRLRPEINFVSVFRYRGPVSGWVTRPTCLSALPARHPGLRTGGVRHRRVPLPAVPGIDEPAGNQADAAISYSALASLREAFGNPDQAVAHLVCALAIQLYIGTATVDRVQQLAGRRRTLGSDRFRSATRAAGLDEESATSLMTCSIGKRMRPPGTDPAAPRRPRPAGEQRRPRVLPWVIGRCG